MRVAVVFPWRPQPGRLDAYAFTRSWWESILDASFYEVDTDHEPFNLAACRNRATAIAADHDVVVIPDADTIIDDARHVYAAIDAAGDGQMHMPFTNQLYLDEHESTALRDGVTPTRQGRLGNGACYIISPEAYWAAGGSDERFSGWGGDDDQLVAACTALIGLVRHEGTALSLWHPAVRDVGSERHRPNAQLAHRYWDAIGSPRRMRQLIAER